MAAVWLVLALPRPAAACPDGDFVVSAGTSLLDPTRIETVSYGSEKAQGTDEGSSATPPSWAYDRRGDFVYLRGGDRP